MIVLVNIVSKFHDVEDKTRPPTGLLYVGAALKRAGYEVVVFHLLEREIDAAIAKIASLQPLFIGFSLFTGYPCYTSTVMSRKLKSMLPSTPIVWGGIYPSLSPHESLREPFVDYVVIGEGEETVIELVEALKGQRPLAAIKGIGYKEGSETRITERRPKLKNLDEYIPDWSLLNPRDYVRYDGDGHRSICIVTSRGCPAGCGFCFNKEFNNRRWRPHSVDFVVSLVEQLKEKTGIDRISFDDDNFLVRSDRGIAILEELKKRGIRCSWFSMRLESVTRETMARLSELEVERIFFGWESGSDRILKLIDKGLTRKTIIDKCRILSDFPGIGYDASAIIGFPTETWREVQETIDTALEMSAILPNVVFNLGTYMPYPTGTRLYELAKAHGFRPPASNEEWKNFDILQGRADLTWLPWAARGTKRKFYLIDKYAHLIDKSVFHLPGKNSILGIVKMAMFVLARLRLRVRFFAFPLEVYLQTWWAQRLLTKRLLPGSRS